MKKNLGMSFMILGTMLLLGALSLFLWNQKEDKIADNESKIIITELKTSIEYFEKDVVDPYNKEMETIEINGHEYIGYLFIPTLNIDLPVMAKWNEDNLKIAPCRYSGDYKTGSFVIAAHNYRSHFGRLTRLEVGQEIIFIDVNGQGIVYEVFEIIVLSANEVEEMKSKDYDLTLFTCTYGGDNRYAIRCLKK